jgi:hypothetical protein
MVKNTLEICEYVMTEEEKNALKNNLSLSDQELIENATNIEKRSFRMMWEFEGLDPDIEERNQLKMNKSQRKAATYLAIGRRVREYKKYLAKISGNTHDYDAEKLRPRPPLQEPGTPHDNHSVLSFFGGDRNRSSNTSSGTNNPTSENDLWSSKFV